MSLAPEGVEKDFTGAPVMVTAGAPRWAWNI